jgi:cell division protein ZapA (FtsZ GTPase activity inhibitor)
VEVEVFGQRLTLTSDKSADELRQIAASVDRQLQRAAEQAKIAVLLRVAVIAALTIA